MFNIVSKTVTTVGVIGAFASLMVMFFTEGYKYVTLSAADYAAADVSDILTRSAFIFFLVAIAGLLGIAAQWLDRLSR